MAKQFSSVERAKCAALFISGFTYQQIAHELNKEFHEGNNVRSSEGVRNQIRFGTRKKDTTPADAEELKPSPILAEVNKAEQRQSKREERETNREIAFRDMVMAALGGIQTSFPAVPPMPEVPQSSELTDVTPMLELSDHHSNRTVDPLRVEGFNSYNFDIYARRFWSIIRHTIQLCRSNYTASNRIVGLVVNLLGDIGNDSNRRENVSSNEVAENVASLMAGFILAQGIDALLRAKDGKGNALFPKIHINAVVGNEPRMDEKINWQEPERNWDWMIYQFISMCLGNADGRLTYTIPFSYAMVTEVMGWYFLLTHGHETRGGAMGIPYYSLWRTNSKQQSMRRDRGGFDAHIQGHLHTDAKIPDPSSKTFINLSLCGTDGYAHGAIQQTSEIGQTLHVVSDRRMIIGEHVIDGTDEQPAPFIYSRELLLEGAHTGMLRWRQSQIV